MKINNILKSLDEIRLDEIPLKNHVLSSPEFDEHSKDIYATQLATIMLSNQDSLSESQGRLYRLIIASMGLNPEDRAKYFEQAQKTTQKELREIISFVKEHDLAGSFIVDAMVLCRIETPLSEKQSQLFSELSVLMGLSNKDIDTAAATSAVILGLPTGDLSLKFVNDAFSSLKLSVWDEFRYQELTSELLQAGADYGYWLVRDKIEIDSSWSISNSNIRFLDSGAIVSSGSKNKIRITSCKLEHPVINISCNDGNSTLFVEKSDFIGQYDKHKKHTCLTINMLSNVSLLNCNFETEQARSIAIYKIKNKAQINRCDFINCGHEDTNGGAILSHDNSFNPSIYNSYFSKCKAYVGGAVFIDKISMENTVNKCHFEDCISTQHYYSLDNLDASNFIYSGSAIYCKEFNDTKGKINNSSFHRNCVSVEKSDYCSGSEHIISSEFIDSTAKNHNDDFIYNNSGYKTCSIKIEKLKEHL